MASIAQHPTALVWTVKDHLPFVFGTWNSDLGVRLVIKEQIIILLMVLLVAAEIL